MKDEKCYFLNLLGCCIHTSGRESEAKEYEENAPNYK